MPKLNEQEAESKIEPLPYLKLTSITFYTYFSKIMGVYYIYNIVMQLMHLSLFSILIQAIFLIFYSSLLVLLSLAYYHFLNDQDIKSNIALLNAHLIRLCLGGSVICRIVAFLLGRFYLFNLVGFPASFMFKIGTRVFLLYLSQIYLKIVEDARFGKEEEVVRVVMSPPTDLDSKVSDRYSV